MSESPFKTGGKPVLLSSDVAVSNGGAILDQRALSLPTRAPMVIDEVRFMIEYGPVPYQWVAPDNGPFVSVMMKLGRHRLMETEVPIWLLGSNLQRTGSGNGFGGSNNVYGPEHEELYLVNGPVSVVTVNQYRWKLPRPMFVAPGMMLSCAPVIASNSASRLVVSYAGRELKDVRTPRTIDVPYVMSTGTGITPSPTAAFYNETDATQLANRLSVPVYLQRLIYREAFNNYLIAAVGRAFQESSGFATAVLKDSHGNTIVRTPISSSDAVDPNRRSWDFKRVLPPGEYYTVAGTVAARAAPGGLVAAGVSLIGYREEEAR